MGRVDAGGRELRPRAELDTDMSKVNEQLASIVEEQHQRRLALLKRNEDVTRDIVDVEVDIRRLDNVIEHSTSGLSSLNDQRVDLEGNHRRLNREVEDLTREDDGLKEENSKLSLERNSLDEEVSRLKRLKADYIAAVAKFKSEKAGS